MAGADSTVLLVEDEALIALDEARRLEEYGYSVVHALTGEEAIGIVEARPGGIGIILMDIDLGRGMDGTEAAQRILARYDIPVLFLSSHVERQIVARTEGITNYGYVVKSSSLTVLDASIKMALKLFEARRRINAMNMSFEAANEELRVSLERLQRSNDELAKSEDKFSKAFDLNPDSININRLSDGAYVTVNQGFTRITGYARDEVIGRSSLPGDLGIWVRAEDRERLVRGLREKGEVTDLEAEFRRKDGSVLEGQMTARVIEVAGEPCVLSITKDVSESRRIERELREAELRFRTVFEDAPVGIAITAPDGRLRMVNRAFCELAGRGAAELTAADFSSITHPEDRAASWEKARLLIAGEARTARFVKRYSRPDGSVAWADVSVTLARDEAGRPDFFITQALGISSAIAGAHAAAAAGTPSGARDTLDAGPSAGEERLEGLLREKELMLREVHHRVKNNLNTVVSLLNLQASECGGRPAPEILAQTAGRVQCMAVLYQKLFETRDFRSLGLGDYLSALVSETVATYPDADKVRSEIDAPAIELEASALSPLGILVNELVANAMKYAFAGRESGLIRLRARREGGRISLAFEDDGVGFAPGGAPSGSGGFGLQLVETMVRQLRGTLRRESGPEGTRYAIEFSA